MQRPQSTTSLRQLRTRTDCAAPFWDLPATTNLWIFKSFSWDVFQTSDINRSHTTANIWSHLQLLQASAIYCRHEVSPATTHKSRLCSTFERLVVYCLNLSAAGIPFDFAYLYIRHYKVICDNQPFPRNVCPCYVWKGKLCPKIVCHRISLIVNRRPKDHTDKNYCKGTEFQCLLLTVVWLIPRRQLAATTQIWIHWHFMCVHQHFNAMHWRVGFLGFDCLFGIESGRLREAIKKK